MTESKESGSTALLDEAVSRSDEKGPVAHLVLKQDWPIALCGAMVKDHFGIHAPAMDRCTDCLKIAATRGLGRPGWESRG